MSIASNGVGFNDIGQLLEKDNVLTTVTISGSAPFDLGSNQLLGHSNLGDGVVTDIAAKALSQTKIQSSLKLIDASTTTGGVKIVAGATNTSNDGDFANGASLDPHITVVYTGLKIKGGSGQDIIENDAKNGIVKDGSHDGDVVTLGGAGATATLGDGAGDTAFVGTSHLGITEVAGAALGESVTFGLAANAQLIVGVGAEAGSTAPTGTGSIGQTTVFNAAAGMKIDFFTAGITSGDHSVDATNDVEHSANLTTAENAAVQVLGPHGVAFFNFGGNEYLIATKNDNESAVSSTDAVVKLVGVQDLSADMLNGVVTLHA